MSPAVIHAAMSWHDVHLYSFSAGKGEIEGEGDAHQLRRGAPCQPSDPGGYTYDIGDTRKHAVEIKERG